MKKMTGILMASLLVIGLTGVVMAQSDNHDVDITVSSIALLDISGGDAAITLTTGTAGTDLQSAQDLTTADVAYSHNQASNQEIIATAAADGGNGSNDITLQVNFDGGGWATIVNAGVDQSDIEVINALGRGYDTVDLGYQASATLANTQTGVYSWTVTLTMQDDS